MSKHGPHRRYAPVRGTQSDVLRQLRTGEWFGAVEAFSRLLGRPTGNVWIAIAALDARGLIVARRADDESVRLRVTRAGRSIRL